MISYDTVYTGGSDEIVEKKSRFIAQVFPVETEEEVLQILEETRKKYWDARHNCYAFVLGAGGRLPDAVMTVSLPARREGRFWRC